MKSTVFVVEDEADIAGLVNNPEYLLTVRGAGYKMMLPRNASVNWTIA
jgi:hypothetical protein